MLKNIGTFFQNEVLGMRWLNRLIGKGLEVVGLDTSDRVGGSIQFFIYDTTSGPSRNGNSVLFLFINTLIWQQYVVFQCMRIYLGVFRLQKRCLLRAPDWVLYFPL